MATKNLELEYDFDVTFDEMPPEEPRLSKWDNLIAGAREAADKAEKEKKRALDGGAPWVFYPKDRKPVVNNSNLGNLRQRYGPKSRYAEKNGGESFEFKLTNRVTEGGTTKGVLWVRRASKRKKET